MPIGTLDIAAEGADMRVPSYFLRAGPGRYAVPARAIKRAKPAYWSEFPGQRAFSGSAKDALGLYLMQGALSRIFPS